MLFFLFLRFSAKSLSVCHDFLFPLGLKSMLFWEIYLDHSENVAYELALPPEDFLTDDADVSSVSILLI